MKRFFFVDGKMTNLSSVLVVAITFGGILGVLYFQPPFWLGVGILAVSIIIGVIGAVSGAAESVGLKPFTNDPLGWRKAKQSYKEETAPEQDLVKKTKT
ncbi:hypothetical protein [Limnohabitans sp.]|uniref:hypothetical protein n=1 Tax=Limnohabitans sp. TaxID=1907725 RepID=UPI0031FCA4FD